MENISSKNPNINLNSPLEQNHTQQKENFTALNKEQIKKDTAEFTKGAKQGVEENWAVQNAKDIVSAKDSKKLVKSIALTAATIIGVSILGNSKFSVHKMTELGISLSEALNNNKLYSNAAAALKKLKSNTGSFLRKSKTIDDIINTLKNNKAIPKLDVTRGYGQGFSSIFALTPIDILKTQFSKMKPDECLESLKKLAGSEIKAKKLQSVLMEGRDELGRKLSNKQICKEFTKAIQERFNCKTKRELYEILSQLEKGKITGLDGKLNLDVSEFTNVVMNGEKKNAKGIAGLISRVLSLPFDFISEWWHVNLIDKAGSKIAKAAGKNWKPFGRGNLGNSLIKYNVVAGELADTKIGSLLQKSIIVPTESIGNHVNDMSGMGLLLGLNILKLYNNAQDAPKGQKAATVADDYIGTIGSIAISTPLAFAATYGLASLGNLEGKSIFSKILKVPGKIFSMGLDPVKNGVPVPKQPKNIFGALAKKISGLSGGALRFGLVMFVFSAMFSKPMYNVIHKIFGKPYDKQEEIDKQKMEQAKNQVIPELGISLGELEEKIKNNPDAIEKLQKDPELVNKVSQNPKLILDLLDNKDIKDAKQADLKENKSVLSPANSSLLNNRLQNNALYKTPLSNNQNVSNNQNLFSNKTQDGKEQQNLNSNETVDTATYIPSSAFVASNTILSEEQSKELEEVLNKSDKVLRQAEKYI